MLAAAVTQFFRAPAPVSEVRTGAIYRRNCRGKIVETAKVIGIAPDAQGIPHVRYEVLVERNRQAQTRLADRRILNLATFSSEFSEATEA